MIVLNALLGLLNGVTNFIAFRNNDKNTRESISSPSITPKLLLSDAAASDQISNMLPMGPCFSLYTNN